MISRKIFLAVMLSLFSLGVYAMGGKVMFSAVNGQVVQSGKPVASAKVVREYIWQWNGKKVVEETKTDAEGNFSFKQASRTSFITSIFPHEPVINQEITIFFGDKKYIGWRYTRHNYEENGELKRPINIICDLANEPDFYFTERVLGICKQK